MRNLEHGTHREGLCNLSPQPAKRLVGEEDIVVDFAGELLDAARVGEAECFAPLREGGEGVAEALDYGVGGEVAEGAC